jgi:hypothetical protein
MECELVVSMVPGNFFSCLAVKYKNSKTLGARFGFQVGFLNFPRILVPFSADRILFLWLTH